MKCMKMNYYLIPEQIAALLNKIKFWSKSIVLFP